MADGVGLSVGATNLAAVVVGRTAVTRSSMLTLYPHRPPEVGVPSENPNLNEPGLIITDFVDRVGDPVGIVASDGSTHRGEDLLADALRALLNAATRGQPPAEPVGVTYPAHWRPSSVDALRNALASVPELRGLAPVVSDVSAALTALHDDPGAPTRGVIALCDFGGTGTSITLVDAANGYQPIGPTVRHTDLSGDLIDQALLTHVINDLAAAGSVDLSGTSAIGALTRLRGQCRTAKERLSTTAVTSLVVELPGHRSDVRLTRNELDDAIRQPLTDFVGVLQETLHRSGIRPGDLVAVASVGRRCADPDHHHHAVRTVPGAGHHHPAAGVDGRDRRRADGRPRHGRRGRDVDGRAAAAPVAAAAPRRWRRRPEARGPAVPGPGLVGGRRVPDVAPNRSVRLPASGRRAALPMPARRSSSSEPRQSRRRQTPCRGIGVRRWSLVAAVIALLAALGRPRSCS